LQNLNLDVLAAHHFSDADMQQKTTNTSALQIGECKNQVNDKSSLSESMSVQTSGGKMQVNWEDKPGKKTLLGSLVFFEQFLNASGLFNTLVAKAPLEYSSPNAPDKRSVLGTFLISILSGHTRYAHIEAIRHDQVSQSILGLKKLVSEDSARAAIARLDKQRSAEWLSKSFFECAEPLLDVDWVLDVDTTIKTLYGEQEGSCLGYNPSKPGRPSRAYHTYWIASLRICLGVDVHPGNQSSSAYGLEHLVGFIQSLPFHKRPKLVRGDCGYGNDTWMRALEALKVAYLFKLRQTKKCKQLIASLVCEQDGWKKDVDGWEFASSALKLSGWTQPRRVIVYRRLHVKKIRQAKESKQLTLFAQSCEQSESIAMLSEDGLAYEFAIYVTNSELESAVVGSTYRSRGDNENCYDELKNQWGWSGYSTQNLKNTQTMACLVALFYNWWRLFIGLVEPGPSTREAKTSRPLFLESVAIATTHRSQQHLCISWIHAQREKITECFTQAGQLLNRLLDTAEHLDTGSVYRQILSAIFPQLSEKRLKIEAGASPG